MAERWRGDLDDEPDFDEATDWEDDEAETAECPHCRKEIFEDSVQCPHCGEYLAGDGATPLSHRPMWWLLGAAMALASCAGFVLFFR